MSVFEEYAKFYDVYYASKDYVGEAAFVLELAERFGQTPRTLLDMGCGTGRHLEQFLKLGLRCDGFDLSDEMLKQARQLLAGTSAQLSQADLRTFQSSKTYDVVVSMFAVMGYLVTNEDLVAGFRTAYRHLKPGGLFIFDGWFGPAVLSQRPEYRRHEYRDNGNQIVREANPLFDVASQTVTVRYEIQVSQNNRTLPQIHEEHRMRLLFAQEVAFAAAAAGLEVVHSCPFREPEAQLGVTTWSVSFVVRRPPLSGPVISNGKATAEVEWVVDGEQVVAMIIPAACATERTEFLSPKDNTQQLGFIVYPQGGTIIPHRHHDIIRTIVGTSETLLVRSGRCYIDFYRNDKTLLDTRELRSGDVVALIGGGHGFRMLEDTVFLEIKQGPYIGEQEKERFTPE